MNNLYAQSMAARKLVSVLFAIIIAGCCCIPTIPKPPDVAEPDQPLSEAGESYLRASVTLATNIDGTVLEHLVPRDVSVPSTWNGWHPAHCSTDHGGDNWQSVPSDPSFKARAYFGRSDLQVAAGGSHMHIAASAGFVVDAAHSIPVIGGTATASCPADLCQRIGAQTAVDFDVSISPDWHIIIGNVVPTFAPNTCSIHVLGISFLGGDGTPMVRDAGLKALTDSMTKLSAEAASLNIKDPMEALWVSLQKPIAVPVDPVQSLYLHVSPTAIELSSLSLAWAPLQISGQVGLRFRVAVNTDASGGAPVALPLLSSPGGPPGFAVNVPTAIPYTLINSAIARAIAEQKPTVNLGGKPVPIQAVTVGRYQGSRMMTTATIKDASLYLVGTPIIDNTNGTLSLQDLDYELHTKSVLLTIAQCLDADAVRKVIDALVHVSIKDQLAAMDAKVSAAIRNIAIGGGSTLNLVPMSFEYLVYAGQSDVKLMVAAHGDATIHLSGPIPIP